MTTTYLGSSTGLRLRHDQPTGRVELNGKSADFGRSVWAGTGTRDFRDVSVADLAGDVARKMGWSQRRVDLPAGRYETLLPPSAVSDLMIYLYWTMQARDADEGRSVFAKPRWRQPDRRAAGGPAADPAQRPERRRPGGRAVPDRRRLLGGGLGLRQRHGHARGELDRERRADQSHPPARLGAEDDGAGDGRRRQPDPRGRRRRPATPDEMIAATERGLLLTTLWYIREVDPQTLLLTGLTRDGVFLVEDGEVTGAVNNFRFNESPVDLLAGTVQAGRTERTLPREWNDWFTRAAMPTLRVPDFNMSSVSPAS